MTPSRGRSAWGGVRKLPSGRFQARYCVDGNWFKAPHTFRTKRDAEAFLADTRADIGRGTWVSPSAGTVLLRDYAATWLSQRSIRPRTRELYEGLLRRHILPDLGELSLNQITSLRIRSWHASRVSAATPGASTLSKCYRLLHAIFQTALEDDFVVKNPCILRGASVERPKERPIATVAQVFELYDEIDGLPLRGAAGDHMAPIHPGEVCSRTSYRRLGVTQHLAISIGVPPRRINEIVHGKRRISADTALRLARYFGTSERFWINLQARYDLELERDHLGPTLDAITPLAVA